MNKIPKIIIEISVENLRMIVYLSIIILFFQSCCTNSIKKETLKCKDGTTVDIILPHRLYNQTANKLEISSIEIPYTKSADGAKIKVGKFLIEPKLLYQVSDIAQVLDISQFQSATQFASIACSNNEDANKERILIIENSRQVQKLALLMTMFPKDEESYVKNLNSWIDQNKENVVTSIPYVQKQIVSQNSNPNGTNFSIEKINSIKLFYKIK